MINDGLNYSVASPGTGMTTDIDASTITPPATQPGPNIAPYLTAFGGLTSAYAQFQTGKINASIDNYNANLARLQAAQSIAAGQDTSNQEAARQKQREGAIAANIGAQGLSGPTAQAATASSRNMSAMDQLMIQTNARRQAYGYQVRAASEQTQAELDQAKGRTGVAATLLTTGAQEELEQVPGFQGQRFGLNFSGGGY